MVYDSQSLDNMRAWRANNKDKIAEYNARYYQKCKQQTWTCELCDCTVKKTSKYAHLKTQKHADSVLREERRIFSEKLDKAYNENIHLLQEANRPKTEREIKADIQHKKSVEEFKERINNELYKQNLELEIEQDIKALEQLKSAAKDAEKEGEESKKIFNMLVNDLRKDLAAKQLEYAKLTLKPLKQLHRNSNHQHLPPPHSPISNSLKLYH